MVDKGEGDNRYQELKDGIYHGYQPLRARKTLTYSYTPEFMPGALNIAVARDIDSIPSGPKDAGDYQMITAHKVNRAPKPEDPYAWSAPKVAAQDD
ncbi:unnamed protein product [Meloidogyne enterolobii]|uniref:Uncharacterized protein n=2 Tax=Meloidogyne enterolobii TaxID=390850 RepID=A0ACB0XRY3_MELEN|nr:unnamed protein product [Meloidogyne enterolobii]